MLVGSRLKYFRCWEDFLHSGLSSPSIIRWQILSFIFDSEAQKEWVRYKFNWQKMPRQGRNPIEVTSSICEAEEASFADMTCRGCSLFDRGTGVTSFLSPNR